MRLEATVPDSRDAAVVSLVAELGLAAASSSTRR